MFRNLRLSCAALALSVLVPSLVGAEVIHSRFRGESASATFYEHSTYCIQTYTDLSVTEIANNGDNGQLSLYVSEYDRCEDTYSTVFYAWASLPRAAYSTSGGHLSTASLRFTVVGYGRAGDPGSAALDLTWTGTGEIYNGRSTTSGQWGSFGRFMTQSSGSSRDATVSGSLIVESRNLAATEEAYGALEISSEASKTIYFPH
ncbi:MAG TPA: hypothetical protein VNM67_19525 [Thermoanaerobaculia bacterium]|jgi:hypothetical protein|nr:hypothetical protein [Thermoanaerobaculia bacterium]